MGGTWVAERGNMTITTTVSNQKGGVGKTTMTIHLGLGLAALGHEVGLIDLDPQGHIAYWLGLLDEETGKPPNGLSNLIVGGAKLEHVLMELPSGWHTFNVPADLPQGQQPGRVRVLPGYKKTSLVALDMQLDGMNYQILKTRLAQFIDTCDYVFIDTSPTVSTLLWPALAASDYVLIPTELSRLGLDGVENIMETMDNLGTTHDAKVLGILPTRKKLNVREDADREAELRRLYGDYHIWTGQAVTESTKWKETSDAPSSVFEYCPDHPSAKQAWSVVRRFLIETGQLK